MFRQRVQIVRRGDGLIGKARKAAQRGGSGGGDGLESLPGFRDLVPEILHLLSGGGDLLSGDGAEILILVFQLVKVLLRGDDFPLELVPFVRPLLHPGLRLFQLL